MEGWKTSRESSRDMEGRGRGEGQWRKATGDGEGGRLKSLRTQGGEKEGQEGPGRLEKSRAVGLHRRVGSGLGAGLFSLPARADPLGNDGSNPVALGPVT